MTLIPPVGSISATNSATAVSAAAPTAVTQTSAAYGAGPAATLQLSDAARARMAGDKDWTPGAFIDSI